MGLFQVQLPPNFGGPYTSKRTPQPGITGQRQEGRKLTNTAQELTTPEREDTGCLASTGRTATFLPGPSPSTYSFPTSQSMF